MFLLVLNLFLYNEILFLKLGTWLILAKTCFYLRICCYWIYKFLVLVPMCWNVVAKQVNLVFEFLSSSWNKIPKCFNLFLSIVNLFLVCEYTPLWFKLSYIAIGREYIILEWKIRTCDATKYIREEYRVIASLHNLVYIEFSWMGLKVN